jgi:hypothetical protein
MRFLLGSLIGMNGSTNVIFYTLAPGGSGTKGKVEKIEKLSNILKESCYY